jgi:hypothetical protein
MTTQDQRPLRAFLAAFAAAGLTCVLGSGGALAQSCQNNSNTNLVTNGGFETGTQYNITDWSVQWDDTVDPYVYIDTTHPHSGSQDLALGTTPAPNDIIQRISGATTGQVYTICFWLYSAPDPTAGVTTFEVAWNNVTQLSLINSGAFGYQYYAINVVAQGKNQDYLQFRERNKQGFYYLDDVAVQECSGCGLYPGKKSAKKKVGRN